MLAYLPAALSAAAAYAFVAWFGPRTLTLLVAAIGLALGVGSWRWLRRAQEAEPANAPTRDIGTLREELEGLDRPEAADQLVRLEAKYGAVRAVLDRRLRRGELTSRRYAEAAAQAYAAGLDNLHEIAIAHTAARGIDATHLERRLAPEASLDPEERAALTRRRDLLEGQLARIAALLSQNEAIMTALDEVGTRLAETRMDEGRDTDAQDAIEALTRLARRTGQYAADRHHRGDTT